MSKIFVDTIEPKTANGNITLDGDSESGDGHLEVGGLTSTATNQNAAGFYAKGNGEILIKGTTTADADYIKFSSSGLNIKTATFDLSTTNLIIRDGSAAAASGRL